MCAPSRVVTGVAAVWLVATQAAAQGPVIPAGSVPSLQADGPAAARPPGVAPAPSPAPAFTPAPVPSFTPAPVAPAAPVYSAPATPVAAPARVGPSEPEPAEPSPGGRRETDAHADRVVWMPTAETHPRGTAYFSSYDLILLQAGYALADRAQVTLTFLPIVTEDVAFPLDLSLKGVVVRERRARVALVGSMSGVAQFEQRPGLIGRAGAVTQLCFDDGCDSSLNLGGTLLLIGSELILMDALGGLFRLGRTTSVLVELQSVVPFGREAARFNGVGAALGLRLSGRRWGVDLGLQAPLTSDDAVPALLPVLAATYRTGP